MNHQKPRTQLSRPERSLSERGQSLVEVAVLFPILLVVLSGLVEFGFLLNEYLTLQDAVRNAARFSSDSDYVMTDTAEYASLCSNPTTGFPREACCKGKDSTNQIDYPGDGTFDFFRQTACLVNDELNQMAPDIHLECLAPGSANMCYWGVLNPENGREGNRDDIIISIFSVNKLPDGSAQVQRMSGVNGWSYAENYVGYPVGRNQSSRFSDADIQTRMDSQAPNTGYLLVEVFYNYQQKLKLPWITAFVPDPILLHTYSFMPLVSAEPTPTPFSP
jgi:uncharacterized protein (DUF2237 family)